MKARTTRIAIPEYILLYRLEKDTEQGTRVQEVLEEMKLTFRLVTEEERSQTIGYLTGLPGFSTRQKEALPTFDQPVMVMQGLSSPRMDRLFSALRSAGAPVALKAAVTPTNQNWTFAALCGEIAQEHAYMHSKHKTMHPKK